MINARMNMLVPPSAVQADPNPPSTWGVQSTCVWEPGDTSVLPILDARHCNEGGWRVSLVGDVKVQAVWGTMGNRRVLDFDAPLFAQFTGQVALYVRARVVEAGARATVTLAPATSGFDNDFRRLVTDAGPLDDAYSDYQALTASVVTIRGTAVNVPALSKVPLVSGSVLTSGVGYVRFTP